MPPHPRGPFDGHDRGAIQSADAASRADPRLAQTNSGHYARRDKSEQPVVVTPHWTGREAAALRRARRMSIRAYAAHLGVSPAAVANWERRGERARMRTETQQILDT